MSSFESGSLRSADGLLEWARNNHGMRVKEFETKKEPEIATNLCNLSISKYNEYTKVINEMCIKSAEEGNVHLVLTEKELDQIHFPISEYNFGALKVFLQEEGLLVVTDHISKKIEIFWVDLVVSKKSEKANDLTNKFPAISDKEVRKLLINETDSDHVDSENHGLNNVRSSGRAEFVKFEPYVKKSASVTKRANWTSDNHLSDGFGKNGSKFEEDLWDEWGMNDAKEISLGNSFSKMQPFSNKYSEPEPEPESELYLNNAETFQIGNENLQSDDNVFDIVVSTDDIRIISNMGNFVKTMIDKANNTEDDREKERIVYTMFLTILKVENEEPIKNKLIFKKESFIDKLIEKLNEMILEGKMHWPIEMVVEFEEIKRNRFENRDRSHTGIS